MGVCDMGYCKKHDAYNGNGYCEHCAKELREDRDYTSVLADALDALKNVPEKECSEEVQETINAAIEDMRDVLAWLRYGGSAG